MFLMRTAFWLSLVVLVLPTDARQQHQFSQRASAAVEQVSSFCIRNPRFCDTGSRYWGLFREKAAYGAQLATDLLGERLGADTKPGARKSERAAPRSTMFPWSGTLRPADLAPAWRG